MDHFYLSVCVVPIFKSAVMVLEKVFFVIYGLKIETESEREREREKLLHKSSARGFMCFKLN